MKLFTLSILLVFGIGRQKSVAYKKSEGLRLAAFRQCLQAGDIATEKFVSRDLTSSVYNLLNLQWNLRIPKVYPLGYFLPSSAVNVATVVKCGKQSKIRLIPKSGGHSYEAISWGNNSTVVVDFRNMKEIIVEGAGKDAVGEVQSGALLGPINAYLWENGGYGAAMGNCLTIGMGGHVIGGGVGYFAPLYGLTLDNLIEAEMVDASGAIVRASSSLNPDLFWALRGFGPGYIGIITKVKLRLFQASENKYSLVTKSYAVEDFPTVYVAFQKMQNWLKENEPEVFLVLILASNTYNATFPPLQPGITVLALHIQDPVLHPQGNASFLAAMNEIFPRANQTNEFFLNHIQFVAITDYTPVVLPITTNVAASTRRKRQASTLPTDDQILATFNSLTKDIAAPRYAKTKSYFVKRQFTLEEMEVVGRVLAKIPQNNVWIGMSSEGGAVQRVGWNETAYSHRENLIDFAIHYEGSALEADVTVGMAYLEELWETIQFMDGGETYQNYQDLDIVDHLKRNYNGNLPRLIREKRKWDPRNYFVSPLSLPVVARRRV